MNRAFERYYHICSRVRSSIRSIGTWSHCIRSITHLQLVGMEKRHNGQSLLFSNRWKMQLSRSRCKCGIWVASKSTPMSAIQQQTPGDDEVCTLTFSNFSVEVLVAGTNVVDPHHQNHHYHPTPQPQLWRMPPYAQGLCLHSTILHPPPEYP